MDIPFFPNTGDGTHCFQAVLKMLLAKLLSNKEYSYEELDRISEKRPGKWTWPTAAMLWMIDQGFEILLIEEFDYREFAEKGEDYLLDRYGPEVGQAQINNSEIEREQEIAKRFVDIAPLERRIPTLEDIKDKIDDCGVVIVNLNAAALYGHEGYSGHFVTVCEIGEDYVRLHDPGLPPSPNLTVSHEVFERAWAYPTERDKNLLAVRSSKTASKAQ